MKLIIFTTCKPFVGDDVWRQEQAIKSWTLLKGIEKMIIILGNDKGSADICKKYELIHRPDVKTLNGIPYLNSMFEIAREYGDDNDYFLWTNSDMIFFNDMIVNILYFNEFKKIKSINNFLLIGQRYDWHNPKILKNLTKENFINNSKMNNKKTVDVCKMDSSYNEYSLHAPTGIDYVVHSKTTFLDNFDKNLVIAGTRHDMILVGTGLQLNYFCCDITKTNTVIHQNHGYPGGALVRRSIVRNKLQPNNARCKGIMACISDCPIFTNIINKQFIFCNKK